MEPRYVEAKGPPISTEVSFVRIDPGDWKFPQDNQKVSSLAFQRLPIITVVNIVYLLLSRGAVRSWMVHVKLIVSFMIKIF